MRIALVEDDSAQAQQLLEWLKNAAYTAHWFPNGKRFNQALRHESFDMVIMDWNLPDSDGLQLLRQLRENDHKLAVIFITNRDSENDIVAALHEGADDYLVKPIRQAETLARISSVLRRAFGQPGENERSHYPPFTLNHDHFTVSVDGEVIQLTPKEYDLACFMFQNHGRLLSRNHILECVWGVSSDLTTRTVDTHISKIRRKLGLRPERGWRLVSVYQYGYRLECLENGEKA